MSTSSLSSPELGPTMGPDIRPNFSYKNATHDEVLEDLSSRFILNLPDEELASLERISFQVEQAHWFYEDFIREQNSKLPSLSLKKFSAMLFNACPLLHHWSQDHEQAFNAFMQYKTRVPVCGAIMLNDTWDKCVLVKGWKSSSGWGFPKGKINEQEPPSTCAVREVLEETGYNLAGKINPANLIEMTIKEQRIAMFIVPSVPEDYVFKTKTRKEISKIEWFKLSDLPTWKRNQGSPGKFYLISPFIGPLKTFIHDNKPHPPRKTKSKAAAPFFASAPIPEADEQSLDSNQESSSQTSSADNGGPPTPSPQSVEANRIVHQEEGMPRFDSHFAALLSNLTDSISAEKDQKESLVGNLVHTPTPETSPESQPAVQAQSQHYPPYMSPPESTVGSFNSQSTVTPRTRPKPPSPSIQPSNHSQGGSSTNPPTSDPASLRPAPSRRTTVADISPYLRKQVPPQTTPSHLRRLALLEGIANESARLTPRLDEEERRLSSPSSTGFHFPPVQAQDHGLLYSSGRQSVADVRLQGPPSNYPHDAFQVRPRTSMSTHRPPLGFHTGSMNSNQVMTMMQMQSPLQHPPPPLQSPMGYGPIPFTGPYNSMAPNYQQYAPAAHPMYAHHPGFGHPPPPPHAPRAGMPLQSSFGPATSSSNSAAGTLLSILNGTPASSHAS